MSRDDKTTKFKTDKDISTISTDQNSKNLVMVRNFASLDEILAAIALCFEMEKKSENHQFELFLGSDNYSSQLVDKFPILKNLKHLQTETRQGEYIISLPIGKDAKVKHLRWQQTEDSLQINLEINGSIGDTPIPKITTQLKYDKVYIIGDWRLDWLLDFQLLEEYVDLSNADLTVVANSKKSFTDESNYKSIEIYSGDKKSSSMCELVAQYFNSRKIEPNPETRQILGIGAIYSRLLTGDLLTDLDLNLDLDGGEQTIKSKQQIPIKPNKETLAILSSLLDGIGNRNQSNLTNIKYYDFLDLWRFAPNTLKNMVTAKEKIELSLFGGKKLLLSKDKHKISANHFSYRSDWGLSMYLWSESEKNFTKESSPILNVNQTDSSNNDTSDDSDNDKQKQESNTKDDQEEHAEESKPVGTTNTSETRKSPEPRISNQKKSDIDEIEEI